MGVPKPSRASVRSRVRSSVAPAEKASASTAEEGSAMAVSSNRESNDGSAPPPQAAAHASIAADLMAASSAAVCARCTSSVRLPSVGSAVAASWAKISSYAETSMGRVGSAHGGSTSTASASPSAKHPKADSSATAPSSHASPADAASVCTSSNSGACGEAATYAPPRSSPAAGARAVSNSVAKMELSRRRARSRPPTVATTERAPPTDASSDAAAGWKSPRGEISGTGASSAATESDDSSEIIFQVASLS
mmetsp:Transcript_45084/g.140955  ORF Transcript_45084/g.140955 Transcript_45084/m.140955 type:complete len:251 (+) Transcript_45084:1237-1989(+)